MTPTETALTLADDLMARLPDIRGVFVQQDVRLAALTLRRQVENIQALKAIVAKLVTETGCGDPDCCPAARVAEAARKEAKRLLEVLNG